MYFDLRKNKVVDPKQDIVEFNVWLHDNENTFSAAKHPEGFHIFLPPYAINVSDEYKEENDPYAVALNAESNFQKRRFTSTIHLLEKIKGVENARILDLGCGEGHITNAIKQLYPTSSIYGLDYSISAIQFAHKTFESIDFVVADAYSPPYPESSFDIVILNNIGNMYQILCVC